jgi:hypothetical protein
MEIIMKQLIEIKALPPFLLHLQTGEELRAWLLKNDLLTEKVFVAGFPVLTLIPVFLFAIFTTIQFFVKKWQLWNYIYWIEVSALLAVILTLLINLLQ